jgi:hypothetical protein
VSLSVPNGLLSGYAKELRHIGNCRLAFFECDGFQVF